MSRQRCALIIGSHGQDGSYLSDLLLQKNYDVHGLTRGYGAPVSVDSPERMTLHLGDLADSSSLAHIISEVHPDEIYNLGAQSNVHTSLRTPEYTGNITGLGATRILEVLRTTGSEARFFQACSGEIFGHTSLSPLNEQSPMSPQNPYACAKAYAFDVTRNYRESYGMYAVSGILFNHESPRRGESFVTRKITLSIARILAGKQEYLSLGDLEAKRDWGYAVEFVEGMWRMLQQEKPDDYVLATGTTHSVREFLELCLTRAGIKWRKEGKADDEVYRDGKGTIVVRIDPQFKRRKAPTHVCTGDATKAKKLLGWQSTTTLADLVDIMMRADCEKLGVTI